MVLQRRNSLFSPKSEKKLKFSIVNGVTIIPDRHTANKLQRPSYSDSDASMSTPKSSFDDQENADVSVPILESDSEDDLTASQETQRTKRRLFTDNEGDELARELENAELALQYRSQGLPVPAELLEPVQPLPLDVAQAAAVLRQSLTPIECEPIGVSDVDMDSIWVDSHNDRPLESSIAESVIQNESTIDADLEIDDEISFSTSALKRSRNSLTLAHARWGDDAPEAHELELDNAIIVASTPATPADSEPAFRPTANRAASTRKNSRRQSSMGGLGDAFALEFNLQSPQMMTRRQARAWQAQQQQQEEESKPEEFAPAASKRKSAGEELQPAARVKRRRVGN